MASRDTSRTTLAPAKSLDKEPQFGFAVYSVRDGSEIAELESSCESEGRADMFFQQYKTWGLLDTTFFLVDFAQSRVLDSYKAKPHVEAGMGEESEMERARR